MCQEGTAVLKEAENASFLFFVTKKTGENVGTVSTAFMSKNYTPWGDCECMYVHCVVSVQCVWILLEMLCTAVLTKLPVLLMSVLVNQPKPQSVL